MSDPCFRCNRVRGHALFTTAPPRDQTDVCRVCGMAVTYRRWAEAWVHNLHGQGKDHHPEPIHWSEPTQVTPAKKKAPARKAGAKKVVAKKAAAKPTRRAAS